MTSSSPHFLSMIGKRLLAILLVVIFTCVIITVALQPNGASAQAAGGIASATTTPAVGIDLMKGKPISPTATSTSGGAKQTPGSNTAPQPTPTPYANLRAPLMAKASTNGPEGGTPLTSTRGYSNLNVSLYNAAHLSNFLATKVVSTPIDFHLECWNEASPYSGCKMDNSFSSGNAYSARWQGNVIVPITGTYIFQLADVDDGARFYLDGAFVLDKGWNFPSADTHPGPYTTTLSAGLHNITVDYENRQVWVASLEVRWSGPDFAEEIIPMANRVPECDCTCHPNGCENKVGGPINTRTGNYDYAQQDIALPALGEPLQFKRTYNSLKVGTPALGYGWTDNYNLRLATAPGGLTFQSCGGQQFSFSANTSSGVAAYLGTSGAGGIFTRTQTQPYFYYLTTVNNERYTFNSAGWLIESADAQGHTTALTYDGNRLARVADVTGERYLEFTYDPQGRLIQISDPLGRTIGYGYDTAGDLTVMTDTLGQPWAYTYDGSHRLTEVRNPLNEITEHTEYDSQGRAVRQWQGDRLVVELQYLDTVDALGLSAQTTIITDAAGGVTTDYYSSRGALVQQTNALASTSKAYDANYNPTGSTDPNGHATSFLYNSQGRPLVITDALGNDTHLQYDTQNHLTRLTDAAGASSYYTYTGRLLTAQSDALGLTTIYTYNPQNLLIAQHDPQGRVTEYEYNPWGQRTVVTTTEGVTYYEYDPVGRLITTTDAFNRVTVNAYDNADRLLVVTRNYLAEQPQNYQHAYNLVTSYEYDLAGRQIAITDTLSRVNRNVYDGNGQLIKTIVNADAEREQNELNLYNVTTEYGYDAAGHQVAVTDTLGHVSRTDYDPQSRPVTVTTNYVDGVYESAYPDEDIIRLTEYDPVGNALAQIDPLGRVTRTWHDEVNRVISTTTNYDPNRPQNDWGEYNLITTYGYDQTGNRILITDTLGRVTRNFYDATGRLISTTANTLPGYEQNYLNQYNLNTFYGYDATGRQVLVTNTLGWANRTAYDLVTGRPLTTTANFVDGVFDPAVPDEDIAQSTEYDAHGNPYLRRDAAGRATRMWYDELNRVISVTANYQPDRPQNDEGQYNLVTTYGYDELDNRAWVTDTLGHVTWTQYDALNRAVTVTQNYLTGEPDNYLGQYNLVTTYEYDALGRQGRMQDTRGNATETEYDGLGRTLAQIDPLEQRTEYAYDVLGNRTVLTDAANHVTRFEYDTFNRLITTTRYLDAEPIVEVTHYDAAGNRSETIDARGQAMTYGYDALGRTIAITDANLHVTTFAYDALGRRTAHTDALQHTTVYTPDRLGRQIALADPLGNTTWYGYDVSGNRIVMTDANQIVTRYEYDTLDRLSAVIENDTGGAQINDRDVRTTYAYDALGNRTVMTNAREYPTAYEYDALNRLSRMQDARGKTTEYAYDAVGNRTVMTDANGKVTLFAYDDLNRTSRVDYLDDDTSVEYTYDAIGNRTAMTDTIGTTQYVFDDLNRLTSVTDPLAQTVGYAYDAAGNRTHVIYPDGKVVTTTYDAAGLLTGVIDWDGQTTMYEYDTANRLVTVTLPNTVQTVYTYDEANRLIHLSHTRLSDDVLLADYEFTLDKMGNRVQVIEALEQPGESQSLTTTHHYLYDPLYRLTEADSSTGDYFAYTYDAVGNRASELKRLTAQPVINPIISTAVYTISASGDDSACDGGDPAACTPQQSTVPLMYDWENQVESSGAFRFASVGLPKHAQVSNATLELTSAGYGDGAIVFAIDGEAADAAEPYDTGGAGDLFLDRELTGQPLYWWPETWQADLEEQAVDVTEVVNEVMARPGWQSGNPIALQIHPAGYTGQRSAYSFDGDPTHAARLQVTYTLDAQLTTYAYDEANRLTDAGGVSYTWDDNGNLLSDGAKTYTYDQANRLTALEGDGLSIIYHYNGDGARLQQIVNDAPTTYALDLAASLVQVLVATDSNGDTRYLYGVTRIGEQQSGGWLYHLTDALGSVRHLADSSGDVQLARGYTPYGEPLWTNGTASSRYAFTGEDYDPAVGLLFLRARYMHPTLGIFLARDPWSGDQLRPGSMNGWNYVEGRPINHVDPSGKYSAVALARTFGFSPDMNGITQWLNRMEDYWGWVSLLLDANGDSDVYNYSDGGRRFFGRLSCDRSDEKVGYSLIWPYQNAVDDPASRFPRPRPQLVSWWRDNGAYSLVSNNNPTEVFFIDKGNDGHTTDLPDFKLISGGVGPGGGAVIQDRFGNIYGSLNAGLSLGGGVAYGEGYIGKGNLLNGYSEFIVDEAELKNGLSLLSVSVNGAILGGGGLSLTMCGTLLDTFSGPCYGSVMYTLGGQITLGFNGNLTIPNIWPSPDQGWNWMFYLPGQSRSDVERRAYESYADNPCGKCSATK